MGAKCCMPVRDDVPMILRKEYRGPNELYSRRNNRCSPSWSFRCDNRTHIEDIEDNHAWASGQHGNNAVSDFKNGGDYETEGHSDGSSSSGCFQTPNWQKFHNEMSLPGNSQSSPGEFSTVSNSSREETEITEFASTTPSNPNIPPASHTGPSNFRAFSQPSDPFRSYGFSRKISESRIPTLDSLSELSFFINELSTGETYAESSSDCWSMCSLSELVVSSQSASSSISSDQQICELCSKTLMEITPWGNELATIIAVLVCGHVYHADCLENVTPEASKFDPSCPTCSDEESSKGKALVKACSKTKNRIFRRAITNIDDADSKFILKHEKSGNYIVKDLRLGASSSGKSSFGRAFLRRHFSIRSRSVKLASERECSKKKGILGQLSVDIDRRGNQER